MRKGCSLFNLRSPFHWLWEKQDDWPSDLAGKNKYIALDRCIKGKYWTILEKKLGVFEWASRFSPYIPFSLFKAFLFIEDSHQLPSDFGQTRNIDLAAPSSLPALPNRLPANKIIRALLLFSTVGIKSIRSSRNTFHVVSKKPSLLNSFNLFFVESSPFFYQLRQLHSFAFLFRISIDSFYNSFFDVQFRLIWIILGLSNELHDLSWK